MCENYIEEKIKLFLNISMFQTTASLGYVHLIKFIKTSGTGNVTGKNEQQIMFLYHFNNWKATAKLWKIWIVLLLSKYLERETWHHVCGA